MGNVLWLESVSRGLRCEWWCPVCHRPNFAVVRRNHRLTRLAYVTCRCAGCGSRSHLAVIDDARRDFEAGLYDAAVRLGDSPDLLPVHARDCYERAQMLTIRKELA